MLLLLVFTSCHNSGEKTVQKRQKPNIILIVSDDQGYNDMGAFGSREIITPHQDKLASEGIRFTNFYVTCSACTPSRGSLLTGRYPQRNGTYELFRNARVNDGYIYNDYEYSVSPERILGMDEQEVLFPELLKEAGYVNGIFGKWDLGQLERYLPLQRGFDEFYGFPNTGIDYYTHERYYVPSMYRDNNPITADKGIYSTYLFEREAIRFVKENKDIPFFLYLPFNAPHSSSSLDPKVKGTVQAPQKYLSMYSEGTTKQEKVRRGYMAAVTCMDDAIGNVLGVIDSLGLSENTVVIFFSDNGGGIGSDNSPLAGRKATMWEGGLRVPCIIKWPGKIEKGRISDNFISSLELFPTILDMAGVEKPGSLVLDGFNIMPLLTEEKNLNREEMYWEFREEYAARIGNFKWIESEMRETHNGFYDLSEDIGEKHDISETEAAELRNVKNKFQQWQRKMRNAEPRGPFKNF